MSKLFNHTVQPLGSTKSPVEDLAVEVSEAFNTLESIVDTSTSTVISITDSIGNPLFQDIEKHKVLKDIFETHTLLNDSSDIVLENEPNQDSITVSFQDSVTLNLVTLTQIDSNSDFTNNNQFKVKGKVLYLNIRIPSNSSLTVTVNYRSETYGLNDTKFLSNVIKKEDNSFLIVPEQLDVNTFNLNYEVELLDNLNDYIIDSQKEVHFFYTLDGNNFNKLTVDSYTIKENSIEIVTDDLELNANPLIISYIENTSISELLNALYYEFINHDHSNHNLTKNIDVKDLVNRYINNDLINYKSGEVPNYQFPQYFNREGYNENIDSVYENSILGTVFLSRLITDTVQKYKGLDEDSNKIVFGDPDLGPSIKYSSDSESLLIESVEDLNGLSIQTNSRSNYGLKLNDSVVKSTEEKGLVFHPQLGVMNLVSESDTDKYTFKFDNSESKGLSSLDSIKSKNININNIEFIEDADNSVTIDLKDKTKEDTKLNIIPELVAKKITVDILNSTEKVNFTNIDVKELNFEPVKFYSTPQGVVVENTDEENEDISVTYNLPVNLKVSNIDLLKSKEIEFGNILFKKGTEEEDNNNLYVTSSDPENNINFEADVSFNKLESELSILKEAIIDVLGIGEIDLLKDENNNLEIRSNTGTSKVIFKSPVEFLDITTSSESKINLDLILSKLLKIGKHSFEEQPDGSLIIKPDADSLDSLLHIKSKLKVDSLNPVKIEGENTVGFIKDLTVDDFKVGNTKVTVDPENNMSFVPKDETGDSRLNLVTKTFASDLEADKFKVENFDASSFNVGGISGKKSTEGNLVFGSTIESENKKVIFLNETDLSKANITDLNTTKTTSKETIAESLQIGNVSLIKDPISESLVVLKKNSEVAAELKLKIPTVIDNLKVKSFSGILEASFESLVLHKYLFKKEVNTDNLEFDTTNLDTVFKLKAKTEATNLVAKLFSAKDYNLRKEDKISVGEFNYLTNKNNNFEFILDKAINIVGSSRNSGLTLSIEEDLPPVVNQYLSTNSGGFAIDAEKNLFLELDTTDGLYLLKPITKNIIKDGISYGFNNPDSERNISDLRKWFRADLGAGNIDANRLNLSVGDKANRNGISIGDTRISVIGPGLDCPNGLTVFESEEAIHIVTPLAENQDGCKNLTYQELNVAGLNVNGELAVEGNVSVTDSLLVNDTMSAGSLAITEYAELPNTNIDGTLSVSGETSFLAPISFKNTMTLNNDLKSEGNITTKSLDVDSNASIGKDLIVEGELSVYKDLKIDGSISVQSGIESRGLIKSEIINTTDFRSESISVLGSAEIAGTTILQGKVEIKSSSQIQGNLDISNALSVRESITADNIFTLKDITAGGTLRAKGPVEFEGKSISIGVNESVVQLNGKLQFNTQDVTFNSPVKIFNTVRITDDTEIAGIFTNKSGIKAESYIEAKGIISTESTLETKANLVARTGIISQNLEVGGALITKSLTAESIAVNSTASIANLTISRSLSMPVDTSIIAGDVKFAAITQTNSSASNNFAGTLSVSKKVEFLGDLSIGQNLVFNEGAVSLNSNGLKGAEAKIDVSSIIAKEIQGRERIQPPADLASSRAPGAASLSTTISQRNFVRMDHIISEGISVFNQPLVASTIYYRDLVYIGDESGALGSVNILARQALYA